MTIDSQESRAFLFELYTITDGNTDTQVSMYDIGERLGLEKNKAGEIAERLFIQEFAEMKTLSGGIGITVKGMKELDISPPPRQGEEILSMGKGPILEKENFEVVEKITDEIKSVLPSLDLEYQKTEEAVIDLKTIDVQMLSPNPKTGIIKEALRSIHTNIAAKKQLDISGRLETLINS